MNCKWRQNCFLPQQGGRQLKSSPDKTEFMYLSVSYLQFRKSCRIAQRRWTGLASDNLEGYAKDNVCNFPLKHQCLADMIVQIEYCLDPLQMC